MALPVKFISTTSTKLSSVQIVDGQIIVLSDKNHLYYDINNTRHLISGDAGALMSTLNNHINDTSNPHNVTASQINAISTSQKGVANGVASLDMNTKIPISQIPSLNYDALGTANTTVSTHNSSNTAHNDIRTNLNNIKTTADTANANANTALQRVVPTSGTTNQILMKTSSADYEYAWKNYISHRNFIENWYFLDPVNQDGNTEFQTVGNTFDRWFLSNVGGKVSLNNEGLTISNNAMLDQRVPFGMLHKGDTMTLSIFMNSSVYSHTFVIGDNQWATFNLGTSGVKARCLTQPNTYSVVSLSAPESRTIQAIKLELGDTQTLAYQIDSTKWVMNDAFDPALEQLKCFKHYYVSSNGVFARGQDLGYTLTGQEYILCGVRFPIRMRITPTVKITKIHAWYGQEYDTDNVLDVGNSVTPDGFTCIKWNEKGFQANQSFYISYVADARI